jgi:ribosomal protein S18 acetylase RimI-like enzyme
LIAIRRARSADAPGIAAVHVACWRSAYAGVLPDDYLAQLSVARQTSYYDRIIRIGLGVHVAALLGQDVPSSGTPRIVGFSTARRTTSGALAEGEVETLYVLDDFKERGLGKNLLRASAQHLSAMGCRSVFAWVLRDNPAVHFYNHLGGKQIATSTTRVGGRQVPQTAYAWDPIELLLDVDA